MKKNGCRLLYILLKTSQDIAFGKISIKEGAPKFMADARKTLAGK